MVNLLYQLHSLERLWSLVQVLSRDPFDLYVFLRPDLDYLDPLPLARVATPILSGEADLITPSWHRWGGLNDRFAICSHRGASVYTGRKSLVRDFVARFGALHPESLLAWAASEAGLAVGFTPMRAARVRADGVRKPENFMV